MMYDDEKLSTGQTLEDWVMGKVDAWGDHYQQNYEKKHEEYYRLWRGIYSAEDKTRKTERSQIISPALMQAVESNVAEIEEATFGRGKWFDIKDNLGDTENQDIVHLRTKLHEDFNLAKVRKSISECLLNAAIYGTGAAEVVMETIKESVPASEDVMDGQLKAIGVNIKDRTVIKLKPIQPQNLIMDPSATCIEDALGSGIDEYVPEHQVKMLQEQGIYNDVELGSAATEIELEADKELDVHAEDKIRLTRYYGYVPVELLKKAGGDIPEDHEGSLVDAIVIIGNGGKLLKANANPYMMQDSSIIAFQWDAVPSRFWGRGVCEKGYNSQKALDAELRARIDALALTVHPMLAMDATRIPRGTKPEIRAGKILLTNGAPSDILQPFNFGQVNQITFAQASALQSMVQQATGAVDSAGMSGVVNGEGTASGISMSLGAIIKRHKRTLINFQENFLMLFVSKAAWRYMQFEPDHYPVADYKFNATSSLGIMAREYEVTQLVQLLQTMPQESPMYMTLVESVVDNMNLGNREELIARIKKAQEPKPEQEEERKKALQDTTDFQQAQTSNLNAQSQEYQARAFKATQEGKAVPAEIEIAKLKAASTNLQDGGEDDKEFDRRMRIADFRLKEQAQEDNREATKVKMASDDQMMSSFNEQ